MALTLGSPSVSFPVSTAARNSQADAFTTLVATGAGTATLLLRNSTTTLATFNLNNTPFGAASTGAITLAGVTISATASAGTATAVDNYQIVNRNAAVVWGGVVTGSDTITSGQTVNLTSLVITWPAS
jgi:hypothetical protein